MDCIGQVTKKDAATAPISARMSGGLGNQLFIYAAAYALAERHGTHVCLDLERYKKGRRQFMLDKLGLPFAATSCAGKNVTGEGREFFFMEGFFDLPPGTCLKGYFQHFKYHEPVIGKLRGMLKIGATIAGTVALFVRRGDYLRFPQYVALTKPYYLAACEHLENRAGAELKYRIFSDDPAWCMADPPCGPERRFEVMPDREAHLDLLEAARSEHFILANSTFGIWAARLSGSSSVIIPDAIIHGMPICPFAFHSPGWKTLPADPSKAGLVNSAGLGLDT